MVAQRAVRFVLLLLPLGTLLLSVPLVLGLVSLNHVYGIRTARSFASADAWYAVNRRGGLAMIVASLIAGALILYVQSRWGMTPRSIGVQVAVFTLCLIASVLYCLTLG